MQRDDKWILPQNLRFQKLSSQKKTLQNSKHKDLFYVDMQNVL